MHITIINLSPHETSQSNTVKMINYFQKGLNEKGVTVDICHIAEKDCFERAEQTFLNNEYIIFAVPVYAGLIPSFSMSFFSRLYTFVQQGKKTDMKKNISFLLQGGFPEACQRKCCEQYLENIASCLNGDFGGVLSSCINAHFTDKKDEAQTLNNYTKLAHCFVENECSFFFKKDIVATCSDFFSEDQARTFNHTFNVYYKYVSGLKGCDTDLKYKHYDYL